jgi:alpha-mannosidase
VRLTLDVDNQARDHRLRLRFPTGLRGVDAVAGGQFGTVRRAAQSGGRERTPMEERVATAPAQRFVAVAQGDRGLALFAPGFFEYELTTDGDVLFTVLRAVGELSKPNLPTRPGDAGWPTPTPLAQCLGPSRMELAVAAITADDLASPDRLERMWEDVFVGLQPHWIRDFIPEPSHDSRPKIHDSLELDGEGLVFSSLKPAESGQGIVLRCFNSLDRAAPGSWRFSAPVAVASRCRADEARLEPCEVTEIITIQIAHHSQDGD